MAALQMKVEQLMNEIEDIDNPTDSQRQQALKLLAVTLRHRNARLCRSRDELAETAQKLKELNSRLVDMNRRLELAKKAGMVSKSVH